jgi:hypothetical protein
MRHTKENFENRIVEIDGEEYLDCEFDNCVLTYRGGTFPIFLRTQTSQCTWNLEDAASRTLLLLHALYARGETIQVNDYIRIIREGRSSAAALEEDYTIN